MTINPFCADDQRIEYRAGVDDIESWNKVTPHQSPTVCRGEDGVWSQIPAANTARHWSYDAGVGLWLCGTNRTNFALHSRDWTNAVYTAVNATVVKNATGIDGVANSAFTITATAADAVVAQIVTTPNAFYTTSAFARRKTGTGTVKIIDRPGHRLDITASLSTTEWRRFSIVWEHESPTAGFRLNVAGDEIEVDMLQVETGPVMLMPILTDAATATRTADNMPEHPFAAHTGSAALYASGILYDGDDRETIVSVGDGTFNTEMMVEYVAGSGVLRCYLTIAGVAEFTGMVAYTLGDPFKIVVSHDASGTQRLVVNGTQVATGTYVGNLTNIDRVDLAMRSGTAFPAAALWLRRSRLYLRPMSQAEAEAMTS